VITVEHLRAALKLAPKDDEKLESLISEVVDLWETSTGRLWAYRENHMQLLVPQTEQSHVLFLELWPVQSVSLVEENSQSSVGEWETLETSDYSVQNGNVLMKLKASSFEGATGQWWDHAVRVTYTGGYTSATTPGDVRRALETQIRFMLSRFADDKIITKSQNFEGGQGVFEDAYLHPMFKALARRRARKV